MGELGALWLEGILAKPNESSAPPNEPHSILATSNELKSNKNTRRKKRRKNNGKRIIGPQMKFLRFDNEHLDAILTTFRTQR